MFFYNVPAANQALLIAGGKQKSDSEPFRVVVGHGAFVIPVFRKASFMQLSLNEAQVSEECPTNQGIALKVEAVIAFKVGNDNESIINAARRFQSDQSSMSVLTGRIFSGHLRSVVGSMTVEEIITDRQKLSSAVLESSVGEMNRLGFTVDSFQIQSISDMGSGYINAISAPHTAAIQRQAKIAQAEAAAASASAEQDSERKQAEYARQTSIAKAQYQAEMDTATAKSAQAGPLSQAQAKQEVLEAETQLALRQADLREKQLIAEVIKPAEAEANKTRIGAEAEANKTKVLAEAAASNDRVALDQLLIQQLPVIVEAVGKGLQGSNLTVLNGAEGLNEIAAQLASQGVTLFDTLIPKLRNSLKDPDVKGELES